jgi:hypothetical protein
MPMRFPAMMIPAPIGLERTIASPSRAAEFVIILSGWTVP